MALAPASESVPNGGFWVNMPLAPESESVQGGFWVNMALAPES